MNKENQVFSYLSIGKRLKKNQRKFYMTYIRQCSIVVQSPRNISTHPKFPPKHVSISPHPNLPGAWIFNSNIEIEGQRQGISCETGAAGMSVSD
jgi:hypothetical protein